MPLGAISEHAARFPKMGILHIDAHADLRVAYQGFEQSHASIMHNVLHRVPNLSRLVQVGIRGTGYASEDLDWPRSQGFRVIQAEECWWKSLTPLMQEVRAQMGDGPVYLSFDIDSLDLVQLHCPPTDVYYRQEIDRKSVV